ncbi:tail fiber assembly protein [Citrobacter freundii]|uniref:tail fiber assembly protein n=1 Tax=Citrobacter TaxID=544 RepID=UPI00227BDE8C|nr:MULTISPECIES: tail fiber assembly protein [Citrobacter]ELK1250684.1 tail fiber assembly protein [Citrobacter freundii]ELR9594016.1 tail fiber assembly protein [Citrobacter freundii]MDC8910584.1 tail fiber assembly protein [Citrobacter freundii]MDM2899260.1 tail fiber assembly protein [Citrobacter sp. Cpo037]MDM3340365.1 tail fiber assembly protein [Citrobacter sp. Cf115]
MQNIKNFRLVDTPGNREKTPGEINIGSLFLESEDGLDWYECQALYSDDTAKIMYDASGIIWGVVNKPVPQRNHTFAVSMLWPVNMSVAELDAALCPDDCSGDGSWRYVDGKIEKIPTNYIAIAKSKKSRLLDEANAAIAPLERAVKLGIATGDEITALEAWERYSVMVNRIDTSKPEWPTPPGS